MNRWCSAPVVFRMATLIYSNLGPVMNSLQGSLLERKPENAAATIKLLYKVGCDANCY
jgi:hypothetical protein